MNHYSIKMENKLLGFVALVLTKVITGKLPAEDFLKAYDFTLLEES